MEKSKLIIVEGPQGIGKTTLTTYLREAIPSCDLYRLSGIKDKTFNGLEKSRKRYYSLLDYLKQQECVGLNELFDRTFITEYVYANLGYKEYDFTEDFLKLIDKLNLLNFDIYYFSLYLEDISKYEERLKRDNHHNYQSFSIENSKRQQEEYVKVANFIDKGYSNIKVYRIANDNFEESYKEINNILGIM